MFLEVVCLFCIRTHVKNQGCCERQGMRYAEPCLTCLVGLACLACLVGLLGWACLACLARSACGAWSRIGWLVWLGLACFTHTLTLCLRGPAKSHPWARFQDSATNPSSKNSLCRQFIGYTRALTSATTNRMNPDNFSSTKS